MGQLICAILQQFGIFWGVYFVLTFDDKDLQRLLVVNNIETYQTWDSEAEEEEEEIAASGTGSACTSRTYKGRPSDVFDLCQLSFGSQESAEQRIIEASLTQSGKQLEGVELARL